MRRSPKTTSPGQRTDPSAVRLAAMTLLAGRDFAGAELRARLQARGFDEATVQGVMAEFTRDGVLDEGRYAHTYVASHARRGQGPLRIAADLRKNGVPEALVNAALAQGADWPELARRVRRSRFGPQPPGSWAEKARQARFLQYRGFSSDHIRAATGADPDLD